MKFAVLRKGRQCQSTSNRDQPMLRHVPLDQRIRITVTYHMRKMRTLELLNMLSKLG